MNVEKKQPNWNEMTPSQALEWLYREQCHDMPNKRCETCKDLENDGICHQYVLYIKIRNALDSIKGE